MVCDLVEVAECQIILDAPDGAQPLTSVRPHQRSPKISSLMAQFESRLRLESSPDAVPVITERTRASCPPSVRLTRVEERCTEPQRGSELPADVIAAQQSATDGDHTGPMLFRMDSLVPDSVRDSDCADGEGSPGYLQNPPTQTFSDERDCLSTSVQQISAQFAVDDICSTQNDHVQQQAEVTVDPLDLNTDSLKRTLRHAEESVVATQYQASSWPSAAASRDEARANSTMRLAGRHCRTKRQNMRIASTSVSASDIAVKPCGRRWSRWKSSGENLGSEIHANPCAKCKGFGVRTRDPRSWGFLRRCRHCHLRPSSSCASTFAPYSYSKEGETFEDLSDTDITEPQQLDARSDGFTDDTKLHTHDHEASPDEDSNGPDPEAAGTHRHKRDKYDWMSDARLLGIVAVGAGAVVVLHPALAWYFGKAIIVAKVIAQKLGQLDIPVKFLADIGSYIEVTTSNLERVGALPGAQDDRLQRPIMKIITVMENIWGLVCKFVERNKLSRVFAMSDFIRRREELLASLDRWNGVLMQSMQSMAQDTLQVIVGEVRELREELKVERARSKRASINYRRLLTH
mmetsp:Transcript_50820/g.135626  ORF Transcript_50820/g.135626 Transcript_50820/m.135626 type:complete len:574 (-) Transcript_50820:346-2067(-)